MHPRCVLMIPRHMPCRSFHRSRVNPGPSIVPTFCTRSTIPNLHVHVDLHRNPNPVHISLIKMSPEQISDHLETVRSRTISKFTIHPWHITFFPLKQKQNPLIVHKLMQLHLPVLHFKQSPVKTIQYGAQTKVGEHEHEHWNGMSCQTIPLNNNWRLLLRYDTSRWCVHAEFHISHQGIAIVLPILVYITLRSRAIESFVWRWDRCTDKGVHITRDDNCFVSVGGEKGMVLLWEYIHKFTHVTCLKERPLQPPAKLNETKAKHVVIDHRRARSWGIHCVILMYLVFGCLLGLSLLPKCCNVHH